MGWFDYERDGINPEVRAELQVREQNRRTYPYSVCYDPRPHIRQEDLKPPKSKKPITKLPKKVQILIDKHEQAAQDYMVMKCYSLSSSLDDYQRNMFISRQSLEKYILNLINKARK